VIRYDARTAADPCVGGNPQLGKFFAIPSDYDGHAQFFTDRSGSSTIQKASREAKTKPAGSRPAGF
jgi:hypothetical protein